MFEAAVICLVITALMAYVNHRWIGLPESIGVMIVAMILSLGIVATNELGFVTLSEPILAFLRGIDFNAVLMDGMLSLLLFAGALHVSIDELRDFRWPVFGLAVFGTGLSTIIVGVGSYALLDSAGVSIPFWYCMVFGALISPTDPIAVMGVLRQNSAPASLGTVIAGESLFNDGVGVVLFVLMTSIARKGDMPDAASISHLVLIEVGGGLLLGLCLGIVLYYLLRSIDNYSTEILLTIAGVLGGYLLATHLHTSGPLAMVVTGLVIGNHGRAKAMSERTRHHLDIFWGLIDQILNAVLFVLLGLEIVLLSVNWNMFGLSLAVIGICLIARWITVGVPTRLLWHRMKLPRTAWQVLTWGGLRGGISVALALALPPDATREIILLMTYAVVLFSMLVQGLTIGRVIERAIKNAG